MRFLILSYLLLTTVTSAASVNTVDSYFPCIKQVSRWIFDNTIARGDGSVTAATRLCTGRPQGVSIDDLNCLKNTMNKLNRETVGLSNGAADAAAMLCLAK